jgi:hypothetical protein
MLYNLYRISDAGRIKDKVIGASPVNCLKNFIEVFGRNGLYVFADNCTGATVAQIKDLDIDPVLTNLGNASSFRHVVDFAIKNFNQNDYVYLVEDDYWHLPQAPEALEEGLQIADYVTLYDFPDKYRSFKDGWPNPYIDNDSEKSRVHLSKTCHWKTSNSTTLTFATKVSALNNDREIIWNFTKQNIPDDFGLFVVLTKPPLWTLLRRKFYKLFLYSLRYYFITKKRLLVTALPGLSTHVESNYLSPHTNWAEMIKESTKPHPNPSPVERGFNSR